MTKTPDVLAKTITDGRVSLVEHLSDCVVVLNQLRNAIPALSTFSNKNNFFKLLFLSVYFHDWGKLHKEFQKVLKQEKDQWNTGTLNARHEKYSIPFLYGVENLTNEELDLISLAILSHHKRLEHLNEWSFLDEDFFNGDPNHPFDKTMIRSVRNNEYEKILVNGLTQLSKKYFDYPITFNSRKIDINNDPYLKIKKWLKNIIPIERKIIEILLVGATKWCDHLGSAKQRTICQLQVKHFEFLNQISKPYSHQLKASLQTTHVLLTAPTGTGKTETALFWLKNQLSLNQGRTFYILPYTASINAMFIRLQTAFSYTNLEKENTLIGMQHSKVSQFLYNLYEDSDYKDGQFINSKINTIIDLYKSLFVPIKITTPHQILKYFYGVKSFEMGMTELVGAFLIFDEIHAYDTATFARIVVMIEYCTCYLKAHIMIMTATLPTFMKQILISKVDGINMINADHQLYNNFKRHQVRVIKGNLLNSIEMIYPIIQQNKKVLIVLNTVKSAQSIFELLSFEFPDVNKKLIHGRFNQNDRSKIEFDIINQNPALLVGTQAVEVSLDISYDVLFTDPAPLDALIQRFGRVNRHRKNIVDISPIYVFEESVDENQPYEISILSKTIEEIKNMHIVDEHLLQQHLDRVYPDFTDQQKGEYETIYSLFKNHVEALDVKKNTYMNEDEYEKLISGKAVLPKGLYQIFLDEVIKMNIIKANGLLVQISENKYNALKYRKEGSLIHRQSLSIGNTNYKLNIDIVDLSYSSLLGLTDQVDCNEDFRFI